jgi:hypothetical protein
MPQHMAESLWLSDAAGKFFVRLGLKLRTLAGKAQPFRTVLRHSRKGQRLADYPPRV